MPEPFASILTPTNFAYALIALNFAAFGIDKAKAEAGKRRIAETTLLLFALIGGTPGADAGRELHTIAFMQGAIGLGLGWLLTS